MTVHIVGSSVLFIFYVLKNEYNVLCKMRIMTSYGSYVPGGRTPNHLLPGGIFPEDKPYVKQETCGSACVCKKCCSLQESFHSAQIEQAKAARKSWEEAGRVAIKREEVRRADMQRKKMEDSEKIARLEKEVAELRSIVNTLQDQIKTSITPSYSIRGKIY